MRTPPRSSPGSPPVVVRPSRPADAEALLALLDRCSPTTLHRRFHGAAGPTVRRELARAATSTDQHRTWVAVDPTRVVRGTATLAQGRHGENEVAFLVEDTWFRRGVGRALVRAVADHAREARLLAVTAWVHADNQPAVRFFQATWPAAQVVHHGRGDLELTMTTPAAGGVAA